LGWRPPVTQTISTGLAETRRSSRVRAGRRLPALLPYAVLAGIVCGACLLALRWVFLVPVYQAPDEPSHLDYALTIYSHGLVNLRDRDTYNYYGYAHPYSQYLMRQTGFYDLISQSQIKVQPGYGSDPYYRALDRQAPVVPTGFEPEKNPYLTSFYPFGYYALVAAWLHLLAPLGLGLTGLFFAARMLSVLLLALTLILTYSVARELHLRPPLALALTAAIGFFPLTSFVASYIQPDNLSFTLVTLCIYLTLRGRRSGFRLRWLALLSLALGALLVTKYQFYFCVLGPVLAVVLAERLHAGGGRRLTRFLLALVVLAPASVALGLVQTWILATPRFPYVGGVTQTEGTANVSAATPMHALAEGPAPLFWYTVSSIHDAFNNYYLGSTVNSYWGTFGWLDVPVVIHSIRVTQLVRDLETGATILLLLLMLVRLEAVATRLIAVARRGRWRWALRMATADPFLNSYLLFTMFMFAVYWLTNSTFGPQGRNWIPYLLPAFAVGVVHAPKALRSRWGQSLLSGLVLIGLLAYAAAGSYYSLKALQSRYYGHGLHVTQADLAGKVLLVGGYRSSLDPVKGIAWPRGPQGATMRIEGWAFDPVRHAAGQGAIARVDGQFDLPGVYGIGRPDAALATQDPSSTGSGFAVDISTNGLKPGIHTVTIEILDADGVHYHQLPDHLQFVVTDSW